MPIVNEKNVLNCKEAAIRIQLLCNPYVCDLLNHLTIHNGKDDLKVFALTELFMSYRTYSRYLHRMEMAGVISIEENSVTIHKPRISQLIECAENIVHY